MAKTFRMGILYGMTSLVCGVIVSFGDLNGEGPLNPERATGAERSAQRQSTEQMRPESARAKRLDQVSNHEAATVFERERETEAKLDSLIIDFPFGDGAPLKEVFAELHRSTGLRFVLDSSAEDMDIALDTTLQFSAESLRLRTGLELLLQPLQGTFMIRDGLVVIISEDEVNHPRFFRLRQFEVEDLLALLIRAENLRDQWRENTGHQLFGGMRPGNSPDCMSGGGLFRLPPAQMGSPRPVSDGAEGVKPEEAVGTSVGSPAESRVKALPRVRYTARQQAQEKLLSFIQTHVAPDDWSIAAGAGTCEVLGGVLVVCQTESVLSRVRFALAELEGRLRAIETKAAN